MRVHSRNSCGLCTPPRPGWRDIGTDPLIKRSTHKFCLAKNLNAGLRTRKEMEAQSPRRRAGCKRAKMRFKGSTLINVGLALAVLGIILPLDLHYSFSAPTKIFPASSASESDSRVLFAFIIRDALRLCIFIGMAFVLVGAARNRGDASKNPSPEESLPAASKRASGWDYDGVTEARMVYGTRLRRWGLCIGSKGLAKARWPKLDFTMVGTNAFFFCGPDY